MKDHGVVVGIRRNALRLRPSLTHFARFTSFTTAVVVLTALRGHGRDVKRNCLRFSFLPQSARVHAGGHGHLQLVIDLGREAEKVDGVLWRGRTSLDDINAEREILALCLSGVERKAKAIAIDSRFGPKIVTVQQRSDLHFDLVLD